MSDATVRRLIVVLGVHRSGTSAIARALPALGADLGTRLMPPAEADNPTGFWEDLDIYDLNREMLAALGSDWHGVRAIPEADCATLRQAGFHARAGAILRERTAGTGLFAFKDPRVARLLPFWQQVFAEGGYEVAYVVALRNPLSVARSLRQRNGFDERKGYLLWLDTMLTVLAGVRAERFVVVDYDRLVRAPLAELGRIAAALGLPLDAARASEYAAEFLDAGLRHHAHDASELARDEACPPLVPEVFAALDALAGEPRAAPLAPALARSLEAWLADWRRDGVARELIDRLSFELDTQRCAGRELADELAAQQATGAELRSAVARLDAELDASRQSAERVAAAYREAVASLSALKVESNAHATRAGELTDEVSRLDAELRAERETVQGMLASTSWRITRPVRAASRMLGAARRDPWHLLRRAYHGLPLGQAQREMLKSFAYAGFPRLFRSLPSYRIWETQRRLLASLAVPSGVPGYGAFAGPLPETLGLPVSERPVVSVVIPVHGQIGFTRRCLASIARHPPVLPFEVIVIDDQSPDDSAEVLRGVDGLRLLHNGANLGFIRSCNRAAAEARGEFLCFLNNDTEVTAGWLDELHGSFARFPAAGIAGSKLVYPDGTLQEAGCILWRDASVLNYGRGGDPADPRFNYARAVDYCSGASLMIPSELFRRLGGFDEAYAPAYAEDADLALKVRAEGLEVIYQPLSVVVHHEGVTSGTDTATGVKRYQRENLQKLRERWHAALADRPPPGTELARAADRGISGRVLVLDHCTPTPDRDAGSLVTLNLMLLLRQAGLQVSFAPEDNFLFLPDYTPAMQRAGIETLYAPYVRSVREHLAQHGERYDLVLVIRPGVAERHLRELRRRCPRARILYLAADLHFLRLQRECELAGEAATGDAAAEMQRKELAIMRAVDAVIVHSLAERELLATEHGVEPVHVFRWAMPVPGTASGFAARRDIAFVGGYRHGPNVDAVQYFVDAVFPLLRARLPGVRFLAIGSDPPQALRDLASESVVVTGYVEDLAPLLDGVRVAVAPLRFGAGIKGKIATTLGAGLPCVASSIAVEGMGLADGDEVLVADDPADFAERVAALYGDEALWERLSGNGLAFARRNFGAAAAEDSLRCILDSVGFALPPGPFARELFSPMAKPPAPAGAAPRPHVLVPAAVLRDEADFGSALPRAFLQAPDPAPDGGGAEEFTVEGYCVPCGRTVPFMVDMRSGGRREDGRWIPNWRESLHCPQCGMNNRQRLMASLAVQALAGVPAGAQVYLMEQVTPIFAWMKARFPQHVVTGSEYLGEGRRGGAVVRGLRHENAMALSFADASLDLVVSNDVFEHVPDPWAALGECARVLRPGAALLFTVPFDAGSASSVPRARAGKDGVEHLLPAVYHGNPVSSEGSLVFTDFGRDLVARLRDCGFATAQAELYADAELGHAGGAQIVFRALKGVGSAAVDRDIGADYASTQPEPREERIANDA